MWDERYSAQQPWLTVQGFQEQIALLGRDTALGDHTQDGLALLVRAECRVTGLVIWFRTGCMLLVHLIGRPGIAVEMNRRSGRRAGRFSRFTRCCRSRW